MRVRAAEVFGRLSAHPIVRTLRRINTRWIGLAVLLITSICVFVPLSPAMPAMNLDESWALGLNEGVARGMSFGRDLIFTFGPYSFVFSKMFHPATDGLMLFSSAYLAITYWIALAHVTRGAPTFFLLGLAAVLAGVMQQMDVLLLSYPLLVGLVACRATVEEAGSRRFVVLLAVLMSTCGLLPLIKGSMLAMCALVIPIAMLRFALERRWSLVACIGAVPIVSLVVFWLLVGQPLSGLPGHFAGLVPIVAGYAGAMAFPGETREVVIFLVASVVLLTGMYFATKQQTKRSRWGVVTVFAAFLFVSLKAAFVRHDSHALIGAQSLLFAALVFAGCFASRRQLLIVAALAGCYFYIDRAHNTYTAREIFVFQLRRTYETGWKGLVRRVAHDAALKNHFDEILAYIRDNSGVPKLEGTTDVYSYDQTLLIASGNTWNPRPVMQSYTVYTSSLASKNRDHLLGVGAPDNILFRMTPIDWRLPALEDGSSWPILLTHYAPSSRVKDTLILRRRAVPAPAATEMISRSTHRLGRRVPVPKHNGILIAHIDIELRFLGRLASALFKPSQLMITLELTGGARVTHFLIASMARDGVVLSPQIENTAEFESLYSDSNDLAGKHVEALTVKVKGSKRLWHRDYTVTFERLDLVRP